MQDFLPILERAIAGVLSEIRPFGAPVMPCAAEGIDFPREPGRGDLAVTTALRLGKLAGKPPREVGGAIAKKILADPDGSRLFSRADVAGPGFVNLSFSPAAIAGILLKIRSEADRFGRTFAGEGRRVLLEFASANPTGPLHVAHGRQAAVGDVLANILDGAGFAVTREYYLNDCGNQVEMLGLSILARMRESKGRPGTFPENGYQGDYVKRLAEESLAAEGERWLDAPEKDAVAALSAHGVETLLGEIRRDLDRFRVRFDSWFSQKTLEESGAPGRLVDDLRAKNLVVEEDGAVLMRTTALGDEKDRVLVKRDGAFAYRTPDLSYHLDKFRRGYERVVDLFGPDHHGHILFLKQALSGMGEDASRLEPHLVQHCRLIQNGVEVKMSKRTGSFVTLDEIMDEVGVDAARFFFVMRRMDSHLDFDLDVAKKQSVDNPVYYVQYTHARICQIFAKAAERGFSGEAPLDADLSALGPDEFWLVSVLSRFPWIVRRAAETLEPHRIPAYLLDVAAAFHAYYQKPENTVLHDDARIRGARLAVADGVRTVIRNGLSILGLTAPEKM